MAAAPSPANGKIARLLQDATAFHRANNFDEAERIYRKILKTVPRELDSLHLLGVLLNQRGKPQEGLTFITRALAIRDDFIDAHVNAANIYAQLGDLENAIHHARRAAHHQPTPRRFCDVGNFLRAKGLHTEALTAFRSAMECSPQNVEGYIIYARALRVVNDFSGMLTVAQAGLALSPDHPTLELISAEAYFGVGRLKEGWHAYKWRFRSFENRMPEKPYKLPVWNGEDLTNRSLLTWTEQGPGDEIMYANMFADLIRTAGRVGIQCTPRLAPIFRRSFPAAEIYDRDLTPDEIGAFDFQAPAGNLGEWLRPTFEAFPQDPSYIRADTSRRNMLRARYLAHAPNNILVGISWRSAVPDAGEKSMSLLEWGPILQVPGITFVNLQYGNVALEMQEAAKGFGVSIISDPEIDPLRDMDAHAAQVAAMDLVVSSSNTAAHVAGALGVPTLCMLPISLGRGQRWYWFTSHATCPWYPSLRRFNRRLDGDWLEVISETGLALVDFAAGRNVAVAPYLRAIANAFGKISRTNIAAAYYERLAREDGCAGEALTALGDLRTAALDADGAFASYDRAIAAEPKFMQAYVAKAAVFNRLNRFDDAIAVYNAALAQDSASPVMRSNLSTTLIRLGRTDEALREIEFAYQHSDGCTPYLRESIAMNYAMALNYTGHTADSLALLDRILDNNPDHIDAHYNRSQIRLASGQLREGWLEAEWRLKRPNANVRYDSFPHIARWNGEDLTGKRILIWTEQGIGDEILVAGMVNDAIAAAAHVTLLCTPRLISLFRRSFPGATVDVRMMPLPTSALDPRLDFQLSMSDLGRAFRPDFASFGARSHYLLADERRWHALRQKYQQAHPGKLLIGISWSSHGNQEMGWLKSNNLEAWQPILQTPGATFVNLQYGDRRADLARVRDLFGVDVVSDTEIDAMGDMDPFAAQVRALDLVISTSNTTVHIAGGLGVPTWVLAPERRGRHWYWFHEREDSPWYPSLRFINQNERGDWASAIARTAQELATYIQRKSPHT